MVVILMKQMVNFFQISLVLIGSIGIINHVIMIPMLLDSSGRDSWISILFVSLIYMLWIPFVFFIHKNTSGNHLYFWLKQNFGKFITYPLVFILMLYFFMLGTVTLKDTLTFFSFYLPQTPRIVLGTSISIICFYNAQKGIRSIALTTGIVLPIVFFLGFFVMTANFPHKNYSLLKPMMEHGIHPVLKGMLYPAAGFVEIIFILFLQHYVCSKIKVSHLIILGIILVGLTLGPTMAAIAEFGPFVAANQRFPAFEEWRLVSIGKYIEHLDFLSVYQWLVGVFIRISLIIFLIPDVLQVTKPKVRNQIMFIVLACMVLICTVPISDTGFYWFVSHFCLPISAIGLVLLSILLLVLVGVNKRRSRT
ncbi:spore gernimation protein [Bacillus thuringiensis]|uniref:endospore germination permease n=1 Tax=Bacillus thuringiensis TaxID=1428 RepID=UPI0023EE4769|nr:endospore germination permease [Bacillus thuringiensis]MBG9538508.1 spore gernimation protein [Bacillus thuringiensis]MBG9580925.1 spore gernimation protein [Bacillus thuringiensis]